MTDVHKVLMLVENVSVPADRRVWPEATALRDQGLQVSIISPKGILQDQESYACIEGIHIYRYQLPTSEHKYLAYLVEYSTAILMTFLLSVKVWYRHGFEVIHAANPPDLFFVIGLFYRCFGKKFVFDQHDLSPELFQVKFKGYKRSLHKLLLFLERCSYQTAHLVITSNLSQKQFAVERGHCRPDKVFVVRNGPNLKHMRSVTPEPDLKRGRAYLLAYVGVIDVQDGVEYTLLALHELVHKRGRQDVSLVLMGGGQVAALHTLAHELLLDEYVNFTGWTTTDDVVRYLSVADVGLVPDPQNGLNEYCTMIKSMEYMALGKPIVAFDLAETRFSAQDAALYATPNLVEDFANKIETLLDDEELRLHMGAIGRKRVEGTLSWDETKKNLLLAYEALFSRKTQPIISHSLSS
ncbi:MAG TPA: glycosyltransferase family 4 protein [Ktedonobacteraceae bacterium]|nr:glycosyltransferase family 4 protein [Ktedonobacteraceae bacterium]